MKRAFEIACVAVIVAGLGSAAMAVDIETVPVGNPGNAGDVQYEGTYGAVAYEYNIGKYEVTAGQYTEFLNAVADTDSYGLYNEKMDIDSGLPSCEYGCNIKRSGSSDSYSYSVAADWANRPVNFVSWDDAARFANWLRNDQPTGAQDLSTTEDGSYHLNGATTNEELLAVERKEDATWVIPTEDEWYKAAYYDGVNGVYYDYATCTDDLPSNIVVDPDPGNNANFKEPGYSIGLPYYRTEVGEFENSESPYGTFDQEGNVYEWNEAHFSDTSRVYRGGHWAWDRGALSALHRNGSYPLNEDSHIGFRVSEVPEPATVAILALGGIGILRRRKCVQR